MEDLLSLMFEDIHKDTTHCSVSFESIYSYQGDSMRKLSSLGALFNVSQRRVDTDWKLMKSRFQSKDFGMMKFLVGNFKSRVDQPKVDTA